MWNSFPHPSASSTAVTTSPELSPSPNSGLTAESDTMKRAAAKKLIERYFYQLIDGCGNSNCDNEYCASSGKVSFVLVFDAEYNGMLMLRMYISYSFISFQVKNLTPNQAAAQAIQLFSQEAKLCDAQPTKVARTQSELTSKNNENGRSNGGNSRHGSSNISTKFNVPEPDSCIPKNSRLDGQSTTNSSQGKLCYKLLHIAAYGVFEQKYGRVHLLAISPSACRGCKFAVWLIMEFYFGEVLLKCVDTCQSSLKSITVVGALREDINFGHSFSVAC